MAAVVADELADRGYDVVAVVSGTEAKRRLEAEDFDAVITDLTMPGVDGLELLRVSRRHDPTRPVIVMTGRSAPGSALEANRQGAYDTLTKPFALSSLVRRLEAALRLARRRT